MEQAHAEAQPGFPAGDPVATVKLDSPEAPSEAMDPEEAARVLGRFIRCRPGRPRNWCSGRGTVMAIVDGRRVKRLCACVENAVREARERQESEAALLKSVRELGAEAATLPPPPALPESRHIPAGAREKLTNLTRELAKETARLTTIREEVGRTIAGTADELAALTAEEAQNRRDSAAAEGTKRVAGAQLEELRARLEGLRAQVDEAQATLERLQAQAGQFGARRMQGEAKLAAQRGSRVKDEKLSADRVESLEYRLRQHLARWPELAGGAAS